MLYLYSLVGLSSKGQIFLLPQGLGEDEFCFFVLSWFSPSLGTFHKCKCFASQHLNIVWLFTWYKVFFSAGIMVLNLLMSMCHSQDPCMYGSPFPLTVYLLHPYGCWKRCDLSLSRKMKGGRPHSHLLRL